MSRSAQPASRWVSLAQALVARELVEQLGIPSRRTAQLLGIAPSAVSQYRGGQRLSNDLGDLGSRPEMAAIAHRTAISVAETGKGRPASPRLLLEAAAAMAERAQRFSNDKEPRESTGRIDRGTIRQLHDRVAAEQAAVSDCMHLAQKARDELTRAIFRQIASDSLRHAEIVASLAVYVESGASRSLASGIDRADVEQLILREREAEEQSSARLRKRLGGVMGLLADSMTADERKHERLLQGLLREGFPT